jgi:hypothetical protein
MAFATIGRPGLRRRTEALRRDWNERLGAVVVASALALGAQSAWAQGDEPVSLDRLLKIPSSAPMGRVEMEKKGGRRRSQWQERYRTVRLDLVKAEENLAESRELLAERMSTETSQWKMAAPGIGDASSTSDAPTDYKLTQQLRRDREELARAERAIQDLDVEANLAGVPEDWRRDNDAE